MKVLSTKKLNSGQRKLLTDYGISVVDYHAIRLVKREFFLPEPIRYALFTSQYTVKLFVEKAREYTLDLSSIKAFCVGEKTGGKVADAGMNVIHIESYAADLATYIIKSYSDKKIDFFCGSLRRDTLPETFRQQGILYRETRLYDTELVPEYWPEKWDAVLFFSPSGVQSFLIKNTLAKDSLVVCIGKTTASAVTSLIKPVIAPKTTVESVLEATRRELIRKKIKKLKWICDD